MTGLGEQLAESSAAARRFWWTLTAPWRRRIERLERWARWDPAWGAHMVGFVSWRTLDARQEAGTVTAIVDAFSVPLGMVGVVVTDRGSLLVRWLPPVRLPQMWTTRGGIRLIRQPGADG